MQNMLYYCNYQKYFSDCCEPIILNKSFAIMAELLMRSRYSAFVLANINYLLNSHHPTTRIAKKRKENGQWCYKFGNQN